MQLYSSRLPEISVIIPTYNRAERIMTCLNSVIKQTFKNWEIIIIDDGSEDHSYTEIRRFIAKYENIRYMYHRNRGVTLSRNAGMRIATGKYITFLDSDDEYKTNHLELRYKFMKNNPTVDLIHGGAEIIGNRFVKDKNDLTKFIELKDCTLCGTLFGKSTVFKTLNGFKELKYSAESDFVERAEEQFRIRRVHDQTYIYFRDTVGSITNSI